MATADLLIELFGLLSGVVYLIFEIKQMRALWLVGLLSALVYIYLFFSKGLMASALLQLYYLIVSFYGLYSWSRDKGAIKESDANESKIVYRKVTPLVGLLSGLVSICIFLLLYFVVNRTTDNPQPFADALSTTLAAVATFWLSRSYIAQWLVWVGVNLLTLYICYKTGLILTTILYFIYTFAALYGYFHWRKKGILLT